MYKNIKESKEGIYIGVNNNTAHIVFEEFINKTIRSQEIIKNNEEKRAGYLNE